MLDNPQGRATVPRSIRSTLAAASLLAVAVSGLAGPQTASAAPPNETAFLTLAGRDTFCLEQYRRVGNVVSGTWTVLHPPRVFVHDYSIALGTDGLPTRYVMRYSTPGAPNRPDLDSVAVDYGRDSATVAFFRRDSSFTRRIAVREGFPLLGQSFVGVELALMRLRRMGSDSSVIALHPPTDPSGAKTLLPVRFVAGDSAIVGGAMRLHLAADGSILGLRSGPLELRRVEPFAMQTIVDGFVQAFAPRVAALAAAAAARVEVSLPPAQLERFVGEYALGQTIVSISRDGDHLAVRLPQQPPIQLLATSPTTFFVRKPDLVVEFESDAAGLVTALTLVQGETKNRFTRRH